MRRRSRSVGNFLSSQGYGSVSFKDLGTEPTASMRDPFSGMNPRQVEGSRDGSEASEEFFTYTSIREDSASSGVYRSVVV